MVSNENEINEKQKVILGSNILKNQFLDQHDNFIIVNGTILSSLNTIFSKYSVYENNRFI